MIIEEKTISSEKIYNGKVVNLRIDTVELPGCKYHKREIVEHPGAVCVVALDNDKNLLLVKQFRKPVDEVLIEIPAGKLEVGEDPKDCAIRELSEETGYIAKKMKFITSFYTSAGFSNEKIYLFLASDLEVSQMNLDDDEYLEVVKMDFVKVIDMIKNGEIKDSKTIIGAMMIKDYIL